MKENAKAEVSNTIGSSISFADLALHMDKLEKYSQQTGKHPKQFYNLLKQSELTEESKSETEADEVITLLNPYSSLIHPPKHSMLQGYSGTHSDMLLNNRHRIKLE